MKKLFCAVITNESREFDMGEPIIFHVRGTSEESVTKTVKDLLIDEFVPSPEFMRYLDVKVFEVQESEIIDLE